MNKISPILHSSPQFKELRKIYAGINSTNKGAIDKSIKRHGSKMKALDNMKK